MQFFHFLRISKITIIGIIKIEVFKFCNYFVDKPIRVSIFLKIAFVVFQFLVSTNSNWNIYIWHGAKNTLLSQTSKLLLDIWNENL